MNRNIGVERTYFISQFNLIKFNDEVTDIPEELVLNTEFMDKLKQSLTLEVERSYRKYILQKDVLDQLKPEDALNVIEQERSKKFTELLKIIKGE